MRIFSEGFEFGNMDDFFENLPKTTRETPGIGSALFRNQDKVVITIEKGHIHIEGDTMHYLGYNCLMKNEFIIEFLVRCEYCKCITHVNQFCEYCGALVT